MDKTKRYRKQCEKAENLQRDLLDGDYWFWSDESSDESDVFIAKGDGGEHKSMYGTRVILFRQDQLQKMVVYKDILTSIEDFYKFTNPGLDIALATDGNVLRTIQRRENYIKLFLSREQLWLVYVQQKKYNKVWDGEEWSSSRILVL